AVAGSLVAETQLIGALGIHGTALAAATLNLLAAASAAVLYRSLRTQTHSIPSVVVPAVRLRSNVWFIAAFLSGFALLALEVVWFRFLLLFVTGTTLSFAVMLAVVLAGIALGGLAASYGLRHDQRAERYAFMVPMASGLLCILTYAAFPLVLAPLGS